MADGTLPQLPDDVLQVIYGEVPLRRLLAHRAVCSHFNSVLPTMLQHHFVILALGVFHVSLDLTQTKRHGENGRWGY